MACPSFAPGDAFLSGMFRAVDCHAQTIGAAGYQALASPTSSISLLTTGVLTIFVALFGYRMLVGQAPELRDIVMAMVKIGFVLMLATSWPVYRVLIYDVTMRAPAELAAEVGRPAALPGTRGGLAGRLQLIDDQIIEFSRLGAANLSSITQNPNQSAEPLRWDPVKDRETILTARSAFLASSVAAFGAVRLVAGFLLALGPLFVMFLLFEGTIGLFVGWIRALVWTALGSLATTIGFGVQLALVGPWLDQLLILRRSGAPAYQAPVELFVISVVFALLSIALLYAAAQVSRGFRIPDRLRAAMANSIHNRFTRQADARSPAAAESVPAERNRAAAIADAIAATQRREGSRQVIAPETTSGGSGTRHAAVRDLTAQRIVPLGESYRPRTTRNRISASAQRRDART